MWLFEFWVLGFGMEKLSTPWPFQEPNHRYVAHRVFAASKSTRMETLHPWDELNPSPLGPTRKKSS